MCPKIRCDVFGKKNWELNGPYLSTNARWSREESWLLVVSLGRRRHAVEWEWSRRGQPKREGSFFTNFWRLLLLGSVLSSHSIASKQAINQSFDHFAQSCSSAAHCAEMRARAGRQAGESRGTKVPPVPARREAQASQHCTAAPALGHRHARSISLFRFGQRSSKHTTGSIVFRSSTAAAFAPSFFFPF